MQLISENTQIKIKSTKNYLPRLDLEARSLTILSATWHLIHQRLRHAKIKMGISVIWGA